MESMKRLVNLYIFIVEAKIERRKQINSDEYKAEIERMKTIRSQIDWKMMKGNEVVWICAIYCMHSVDYNNFDIRVIC